LRLTESYPRTIAARELFPCPPQYLPNLLFSDAMIEYVRQIGSIAFFSTSSQFTWPQTLPQAKSKEAFMVTWQSSAAGAAWRTRIG